MLFSGDVIGIKRDGRIGPPACEPLVKMGQEEQHAQRGEEEAADHRDPEWGCLVAAFREAEGHRDHAGDHRGAGHEDRP